MEDSEILSRLKKYDNLITETTLLKSNITNDISMGECHDIMMSFFMEFENKEIFIAPHRKHKKCLKNSDCECITDLQFPITNCTLEELSNCKTLFEFRLDSRLHKTIKDGWHIFTLDNFDNENALCIYHPSPKSEIDVGYIDLWFTPVQNRIPVNEISKFGEVFSLKLSGFDIVQSKK